MGEKHVLIKDREEIIHDDGEDNHVIEDPEDGDPVRYDIKRRKEKSNHPEENLLIAIGDPGVLRRINEKIFKVSEKLQSIIPFAMRITPSASMISDVTAAPVSRNLLGVGEEMMP